MEKKRIITRPAARRLGWNQVGTIIPLIVVFCGTAIGASAQPFTTPPALLNGNATTDTGHDRAPHVATDGQGHWVAVWQSEEDLDGEAGTDVDIFVARSTNNGATWTGPVTLNTNATTDSGGDQGPRVATDGMGNWVVAWRSDEDLGGVAGEDTDLFVARSADNGATWTPPSFLNSDAATDEDEEYDNSVDLTTDGSGHWVAVWVSIVGGLVIDLDPDIFVARSGDNGANWSEPVTLNTNAETDVGGSDLFPHVATDRMGNWIAVWASTTDLEDVAGIDPDIFLSRSTDNGVTWTDPALLNTNATADSGTDVFPQLVGDGAGNWVAVWQSDEDLVGAGSTDQDVFVARSANDGASWTAPALLNNNAASDTGDDGAPYVTTDGRGNWIAVWWSNEDLDIGAGTDADIFAAYSTDNGATWTDPALLSANATSDTGSDLEPYVASNGAGNWVAVWNSNEDLNEAGSDLDIFTTQLIHPRVTVVRPNGGQHIRQGRKSKIEWSRVGDSGEQVRVQLLRNDHKFRTIRKQTPNDGSLRWRVKASKFPTGDNFKIRVIPRDFPVAKDSSDNTFSITAP